MASIIYLKWLREVVERVFDILLKMVKIIRDLVRVLEPKCVHTFLDQFMKTLDAIISNNTGQKNE